MSDHDDFAFEPIPGLPERPPVGEELLWQGRPSTYALARDAYALHWIAGYFLALLVWRAGSAFAEGGAGMAIAVALPYIGLMAVAIVLVGLLAFAQARSTVYTITTARVVMRIGAALSVTFNVPFAQVGNANLSKRADGSGTIALETLGDTRISFLIAWPHVRPWYMSKTQPALRCIPDVEKVGAILAEAAQTRMDRPVITRVAVPANAVAAE